MATTFIWNTEARRHGFFCLLCAMGFRILCRLWERQSLNPHDIVPSSWGKRARGQPFIVIWPSGEYVAGYIRGRDGGSARSHI